MISFIKKTKDFFSTVEGLIFLLGIIIFVIGALIVYPYDIPGKWQGLLTMILTGIAVGKGGSIPVGLGILPKWMVFLEAAFHDLVVVYLFFPLIVFFRNRIVKKSFMGEIVRTAEEVVSKHESRLRPLGVLGVAFFVWIPFTMTGPLIGAVLGLLLGMKTLIIILTVTVAGVLSALCWTFLFGFMINWQSKAAELFPMIAVSVILALILIIRLQKARQQKIQQRLPK